MNYSRAAHLSRFVLLVLAIALVCSVAVFGVYVNDDKQLKGIFDEDSVRLGLDLAGGSVITFEAKTSDTGDMLDAGMNSVQAIMRERLDNSGLTEALCYRVGDKMVTIEIPDVDDPQEAIANYMETCVIEFKKEDGTLVLNGEDIESAYAGYNDTELGVSLTLTKAGADKFSKATTEAAKTKAKIVIYRDGTQISAPTVQEAITDGKAFISMGGDEITYEDAEALANNINAGAFKYELTVAEQRTVGATLGENSLKTSVIAGAIGVLLVIIFMCVFYKVPGIMASLSLFAYVGIFCLALIFTKANLTLAGIAGIVLSVGMAVDANVVIFERMKEELALGKSAKAAINGGFKRAFTAILDSNITTIIACAVLYFLGSGTIKGFATTLFMGVVISLFTSLVITRALLHLCVGMGITKPNAYKAIGRRAE